MTVIGLAQGVRTVLVRLCHRDDWTVAATVAVALVVTWLLHTASVVAWWFPPLAAVVVVGVSLRSASR